MQIDSFIRTLRSQLEAVASSGERLAVIAAYDLQLT